MRKFLGVDKKEGRSSQGPPTNTSLLLLVCLPLNAHSVITITLHVLALLTLLKGMKRKVALLLGFPDEGDVLLHTNMSCYI